MVLIFSCITYTVKIRYVKYNNQFLVIAGTKKRNISDLRK